jgi:hypothetical protein
VRRITLRIEAHQPDEASRRRFNEDFNLADGTHCAQAVAKLGCRAIEWDSCACLLTVEVE